MKPLTNCGMDNMSNSAGDPSLLYATSWGKRNLCLMDELELHALPYFMCLLPFESFMGVGMLSCSSTVSVSSFWSKDSASCTPSFHILFGIFFLTASAMSSNRDIVGLLHWMAAKSGVELAGLLPSTLAILVSMAEKPDSMRLEISLSMSVSDKSCVSWLFSWTLFFPLLFVGLFIPVAGVAT